ncbi:DNA segregation ATPase FtsK/SpoIIIE, S-DNA-T family [Mycolicibacterium rutilum]|uniref:DNA segregation ATPase FtsK/SpoIIIE, S-DNA-T family n=1 Tax=Mycolicibacterium rutilum TaxID=370526 RepID=A0A1H6M527_MYCRU|nr:DNA segregation ATPase FtsK/SpoIIIE, S-DNA-T family [Mycolicibacterium rutilum]
MKPPPALPKPVASNPVARLLPVAVLVAGGGMMAVYLTSGAGTARSPMFMFFPVMMLMSVLGTVAYGARGGAGRAAEIDENRRSYLRYLDTLDAQLADATAAQHYAQHRVHPAPEVLWTLVGTDRMWERRRNDAVFGCLRTGLADQSLRPPLREPEVDTDDQDPVTVSAMRTLIRRRGTVAQLPTVVPLLQHRFVTLTGDHHRARAVLRAMVCELVVLHGPDTVAVAAATGPEQREHWEWLKWLPHYGEAESAPGDRHLIVIADGAPAETAPADTVSVVSLGEIPSVDALRVDVDTLSRPDALTLSQASACARRLARFRTADTAARAPGARGWLELMGIEMGIDTLSIEKYWSITSRLRAVPVGVSESGAPVRIDINEPAHGGIGPHGLCVGATGSGKSEFLRTLVLGMITAHPPDVLNLVLVDFKGGATFLGLERARHVAAVITNLADESHLVARMNDALAGELHRRQELLRAAGNFVNTAAYAQARSRGAALPPLPALFIVVDEFSELLTQHPDFADLFLAIGRLGRSLGIHLLLASQRLDEGRLRGLDTHLSYRICLKTFSAGESRAVLGVPDAHHLPATPGAAYLKTAGGELTRFQTAFVSGACPHVRYETEPTSPRATLFTATATRQHEPQRRDDPAALPTVLDTVLDRIADRGPAAHPVWLAPLTVSPPLDALLHGHAAGGDLSVPIGLVDSPFAQRHDVLTAALGGAGGNVAVVGAPRSGKSTAVRTLITGLAETHSPADVTVYCLDFGGGTLSTLAELPHVGAVAGRADADLCRRIIAVVESVLRSREKRRAAGDAVAGEDSYGDGFLVIDGWAQFRQQFEALEAPVTALASQGLAFGVHVVVTASRWAELRPALKDQIGTRVELRLGDPADSEMDRRRARMLPNLAPGHGITADGRELVIADPSAVGRRTDWAGLRAPRIELLPTQVSHRDLIASAPPGRRIVVGVGERELAPVTIDFNEQPHLLVLGETGCGKSALLRLLCRELMRTADPADVQLEIVDFRRALLGVVESDHLSGYTASPAALTARVPKLLARLEQRMPGDTVTQQQLRERSWWSGPDLVLVIDDYDLVAASTGNPLVPLADLLPHATDLGLHVVVARRSGGAARAMFDPVLARLREMSCAGLMMSASPDEGVLLGAVRPAPQPPGRGTLITRGDGEQLIQVGWSP